MTLTQLRYLIEVVRTGSINRAAQSLFVSQPSVSRAVSDLEAEFGLTLFSRTNRGVELTEEGTRFLSYARQVVEQADLLEGKYKGGAPARRVFGVSAQHYAFAVNAFVALVREYGEERYEFTLRESRTHDIVEDVRLHRSELGIVFLSAFNREVLLSLLSRAGLLFSPLFRARPHVFVSREHPLANRGAVGLDDLAPFPRLTYEQGTNNSFYFAEEPLSTADAPKNIVVTDRATLFNLLIGLDGYTISSGILSRDLNGEQIVSVPLRSEEYMEVGWICPEGEPLSPMAERYLEHLRGYIRSAATGDGYSICV